MLTIATYIDQQQTEGRSRRRVQRRLLSFQEVSGLAIPAAAATRMTTPEANVTQLLRASASGGRHDLDALMAAIYADLRRLAINHMQSERRDHTLQPTAVVHEAYLKLVDQHNTDWKDRVHFFAVASRIIRRILVDHAREKHAEKRGGDMQRVALDSEIIAVAPGVDMMALDEALTELGDLDETQARIVELRFFSGLSIPEVADLLSMAPRSVDRAWQCAKAWLYCRLMDGEAEPADA